MDLQIFTRPADGRLIVSIVGEIDVYTAPQLREQLVAVIMAGNNDLILDLGRVSFIDSTGLGVFISALKRIRVSHGRLELVISHESIAKTFRITGLTKIFPIYGSLEAVLKFPTESPSTGHPGRPKQ